MGKYLKMSSHFVGNVSINADGHICDDKYFRGSVEISEDYYEPICHAINSHDDLVDEVERLRESLKWAVVNLMFENAFEWSDDENADAHYAALRLLGVEVEE